MVNLTKRQKAILALIEKTGSIAAREIISLAEKEWEKSSKPTILRDLGYLVQKGWIARQGGGRSVVYESKIKNPLLKFVDVKEYFNQLPDERKIKINFDWQIFNFFKNLFSAEEIGYLNELNQKYQKKIVKLSPAIMKKELERITIELSWKSSQLEGNTYSLIDTEILIKERKEAAGHTKEEAIMILNHKEALDYILKNRKDFKIITSAKIRSLHHILVKGLEIDTDYRKIVVGIVGTKYRPIDNQFQIKEALDKTCGIINQEKYPLAKALIILSLIAYIQPFADGNKRTSRLLSNALLLANNWPPLSFRSIDGAEYKKAMILFYEQNNLKYLKELLIEQLEFVVNNYFG
jgi:Fic family protein